MINPLNPLENAVIWILNHLNSVFHLSYGWAIVVMVLVVRAALVPLVVRQYRSMRQMQIIAPQLKEVQRKYKGDKKKQQEEIMRLYQEHNANPFASCLPMLAQIPVFIGLYYGLKRFSGGTHASGSDLSFMHVIPNITLHVRDLPATSLVILMIVYGGSQLLSSELSFEPQTPQSQRRIMRLIPIPIVFFALSYPFPAGVAIYWVTTNMWTAGQMLIIKHLIGLHLTDDNKSPSAVKSSSAAVDMPLDATTDVTTAARSDDDADVDTPIAVDASVEAHTETETDSSPARRNPPPRNRGAGLPAQRRKPKKRR